MGKKKHESKAHQAKNENRQKIIVNLDLKHHDRINKWAKLEETQKLNDKIEDKAELTKFTKIIAQQRLQQSRENQQEYKASHEFFKFLNLKFSDVSFLQQFNKCKIVSIGPNQLEMMAQLFQNQKMKYVSGKKLILKSDTAHIHVVKLKDENGVTVEYAMGATPGVDLRDCTGVLNGLLEESEAAATLFDEIVDRWN